MARIVKVINNATVKFGAPPVSGLSDDVVITGLTDYACQFTGAAFTPTSNLKTSPATFCAPESEIPAASIWTLDLAGLQDWGEATSFSEYTLTNDATLQAAAIYLEGSVEPYMKGVVYVLATTFAGTAGEPLTWEGTWPCPDAPVLVEV